MEALILLSIFASFFLTYLIMPFWLRGAHANDLVGRDMHKLHGENVAEGGGLVVLAGFILGVLLYVGINTFVFSGDSSTLVKIFALLSVVFIAGIVGMVDDFLGWKKGLSKKLRVFVLISAAVPLMVINAGTSILILPFLGQINLGLLFPLIIIPLGIVGATASFNIIAGYNGLEASQGIIILSGLAFASYITGQAWLSVIALCMIFALMGFYIFNFNPARVFPGDILTYSVGALIAGIAILGDLEKVAILFFIPYIIEVILKSRGKLKKESFAKINERGGLEMPYEKIYGLEHLSIKILKKIKKKGEVRENDVVRLINLFQILVVILVLLFAVI